MYEIIDLPYNKKSHYKISVIKLSETRIVEIITTNSKYNIITKVMVRNRYDDWSHYVNQDFVGYYNPTAYKKISENQIMSVHNKTLDMIDAILIDIDNHYKLKAA